jgi:4-hydroxy-3-methylbut-2-en-1-yl diphosphate reductase
MTKIRKAEEIGFCFGVRRAITTLEQAVSKNGSLDSLGPVVHNEQVAQRLNEMGVNIVQSVDEIKSKIVSISSHGVSPQIEAELKAKSVEVIDTTCPFVKRAQIAAKRLSESGFYVVVYGEAQHPEVKGILGWANEKGLATLDVNPLIKSSISLRRIGILSQTTQVPENFTRFVKDLIDITLKKDIEIRIIDTICHDIRKRQVSSLELAGKVDLLLVIGGRSSANTRRLWEICSKETETYLISKADEINPDWLKNKKEIGITSGTSTSEETIDEVIKRLSD